MKRGSVLVFVLVVMLLTSFWKAASQSLAEAIHGGIPQEDSIVFTQPPEITRRESHWRMAPSGMGELTVTIQGTGDLAQLDVLRCP